MTECPNVLPGADCIDPECSCRADEFRGKIVYWPLDAQEGQTTTAFHWCPACERLHPIPERWIRSGSVEAPTFNPSFLQRTKRGPCHYFIRDGELLYQQDCFHPKAGQTVPMPEIPKRVMANLTATIFNED